MITGYVRRQALAVSAPVLVADTIDYLTARFVFMTGDWDGLEVWAHFLKGDTAYDFRLDGDGEITADQHLNLTEGVWTVYLSGHLYSGGAMLQRISTQQAEVNVVKSGMVNANPFPPLPATVEEQIFAELSDHEERLSDIEQNGTGGGGGGTGDITGAVRYDVLQELTDKQKMQARSNTGAASKTDVDKRLGELSNAIAEKVGTAELKTAVETALTEAKESGEFKGEKGDPGQPGAPGADYVLTEEDKTKIAQEAAALVDTALLSIIGSGVTA